MIELEFRDKNGVVACNGDTIRYFDIKPEYQHEWGDNIPNGHYTHQVDTSYEWVERVLELDCQEEGDAEWLGLIPNGREYSRAKLCGLHGLPSDIDDDEFEECVLGGVREHTKAQDLGGILEEISGWEIVKKRLDKAVKAEGEDDSPKTLYIVGRHNEPLWIFRGVFSDRDAAESICTTELDFVAPAVLDSLEAADEGIESWPGAYYPRIAEEEL